MIELCVKLFWKLQIVPKFNCFVKNKRKVLSIHKISKKKCHKKSVFIMFYKNQLIKNRMDF